MAANPNPVRITDPEWRLWEGSLLAIPGVRLGGIYANKSGYHNTVAANQVGWPGDYSTRLPLDLTDPRIKARAIDLTMNAQQMILRTGYLRDSAIHPDDDRLGCVREFYGTLNGRDVFGRSHNTETSAWVTVTSDSSHLWHDHISFFTKYCDDWAAAPGVYGLEGVLSVLSGETWDAWVARKTGPSPAPVPIPDEEDDMLTAILTSDASGDKVLMYPWAGTWRRVPVNALPNALEALGLAGVAVNSKTWPGPYDFDDPFIRASWGVELTAAVAGGGGAPSGPVTVAAASVAEIAAASGKAAASEIRADPEQDGKDT